MENNEKQNIELAVHQEKFRTIEGDISSIISNQLLMLAPQRPYCANRLPRSYRPKKRRISLIFLFIFLLLPYYWWYCYRSAYRTFRISNCDADVVNVNSFITRRSTTNTHTRNYNTKSSGIYITRCPSFPP